MRLKTNIRTLRDLQYWVEEDEPFEHLPKFENRAFYFERIGLDYWDYRCYHYYKINPYKKAENIIAKNVGKDYNNSYSYYLKQFPSNYLRRDIDRDWNYKFDEYRYSRRRNWKDYYVDDEGLIQETKFTKLKKEVSICSDDYKIELVHKITKHPLYKFGKVYEQIPYANSIQSPVGRKMWNYTRQGNFLYLHYKHQYKAQLEDFENMVVSGTKMVYTSKNDYRYKRHFGEIKKKPKKHSLDEKEFRRLLNEKKLKDKEENLIKILSHGFDPITSFTKRKHE